MHQITGDVLPDETVPQLVRRIRIFTGGTTYLPRWGETIQQVSIQPGKITLKIDKIETVDRSSGGWDVTAHGMKLVSIVATTETLEVVPGMTVDQTTWQLADLVFWDEDFTPYEMATPINPKRLESNYDEQRAWEDDAYRWGNGSRFGQRDSADRVFQGYKYNDNPVFYATATREK